MSISKVRVTDMMHGIFPICRFAFAVTILCLTARLATAAEKADAKASKPASPANGGTARTVEEINAAGTYGIPNLELKNDENYARTSQELEPFRHVQPYKEHFLEQMVYSGPGRGLPEPEDVKSVKIGFIGPIMSTVSVATGGKSHEENLGIKMLQGAQLAIEHANEKGGYLENEHPVRVGGAATTTDSGALRAMKSSKWPTRTRSGRSSVRSTGPTRTSRFAWR